MNFLKQAMELVVLEAIRKGYDQEKIIAFMQTEIFEAQVKFYSDELTRLSQGS